jgi:hypothetical protein
MDGLGLYDVPALILESIITRSDEGIERALAAGRTLG